MQIRPLLLVLSVIALTGTFAGQGNADGPPPASLVSYWLGDGNFRDIVGCNNGVPVGGVSFAPGQRGEAYSFDGSTGRIFIPDSPSLALTKSLTITAWIKVAAYPSDHAYILFRGDDRIGTDPYNLYILSDGTIGINISDANNNEAGTTSGKTKVPLDTWTFVGGSLDDDSGVLSVYINGNLAGTKTTDLRPFAQLDPTQRPGLGIGSVQSGNYQAYFNGLINEVKIYDSADFDFEQPL